MNGNLKTRIIKFTAFFFIFLSIQYAAPVITKAAFSFDQLTASTDAIKEFFMRIPPLPFGNFINNGKQAEESAINAMPHMDLNSLDPRALFGKLDNWFYGITTFHLAQIVKPLGNLIADIFSFFANLIRQGVSHL